MISHPLGEACVGALRAADASVVPHGLPTRAELDGLMRYLPLRVLRCEEGTDGDFYLAVLERVPHRALRERLCLRGRVAAVR